MEINSKPKSLRQELNDEVKQDRGQTVCETVASEARAWRPGAKDLIALRIKQAQAEAEHYATVLRMLPSEMTPEQDRALLTLLSHRNT
jgi:hypothetical protein